MSPTLALPRVQLAPVAKPPAALAPVQAEWRPRHNPWLIAITVTLATFMELLDTSVANVALPHIAGNLSASQDESTWVLTSYLVSNAVVLPISAWLATLFGRKNFYMFSVALFTVSSALCGMAPSLGMLVFFRVLQGAGGGGLQPVEQAILADTFEAKRRGMAFAVYGIAIICAPALGPTLGGWITDNYSWRWIFYINIPVGLLSLFLTRLVVEDPPHLVAARRSASRHVDVTGLGLIALGLGSLQVVLDKGQREDWLESHMIVGFTIATVVGLIGSVVWELRQKEPIVDFRLLKERNFATSVLLMMIVGFGLYGTTALLPLFLQSFMGYTATEAGMALSFGALAVLVFMPVVGILLAKGFQPRRLVTFGLLLSAIGVYRYTQWNLEIDFWRAATDRIIQASAMAFLFVPINAGAYSFLSKEKNGNASGLMNLARNVGGSIGIAVGTTLLDRRAQVHQTFLVGHATPFDASFRAATGAAYQAMSATTSSAYDATAHALGLIARQIEVQAGMLATLDAFLVIGCVYLCGLPLTLLLKRVKVEKGANLAH